MAFLPPAVSRRIPRVFQRATAPPYLRAGDLYSHTDGSGVDYYDGAALKPLGFAGAGGAAYEVEAYHYGAATWHDAARAAFAALLAAGGGTLLFPAGLALNIDQAGHAQLLSLPPDGNAGASYPARTRRPIRVDLNGCTLALGTNTRRLMDAAKVADWDWFRDVEICNGALDAAALSSPASNEHLIFGNNVGGATSKINFERIAIHHLRATGIPVNVGGAHANIQPVYLSPTVPLNDATHQVVLREIVLEDCHFEGGDGGFAIYASLLSGSLTQPTDSVNALVERCHVRRLSWDSGVIPAAFYGSGCQLGGYALVRDCSIRDSYLAGSGDVTLEVDNAHAVVVENVTAANGYNSNFLPTSFGALDADQKNQHVTYRNCTSLVTDATLVRTQGWTGYAARHHRLGHVELQGCRHESVALRRAGGGSGVSMGICLSTALTQDVTPGTTTYHVAATANLVVGEDVHLGTGAGTAGEWVAVASITDGTTFVAAAAVNSYDHTNAAQAAVVQPTPSERVTIRDFTLRDLGWSLPAAAASATYTPIEINHANATIELKGVRVETQGATIATAGALSVYGVALNGRNLTWDIDGLDVVADLVYGGTQGNFRGLALGNLAVLQPTSGRGRVRGLRPRVVQGFPAANATGLYVGDRTQLLLDAGRGSLPLDGSDFGLLPSGAKEVTWQRAGENVLEVLLGEVNRKRGEATWPRTVRWTEHFISGAVTTSALGETGLGTGDSASGGSAAKSGVLGHPGAVLLDTGTAGGGNVRYAASTPSGQADVDLAEWFELAIWFKLAQVDANTVLRVGVAENIGLATPLYGYWLALAAAAGTFAFTVSNNGGSHVGTANSIAPDTAWHVLHIRRYSDAGGTISVGMALDNGAESVFTAAGDTVLPTTRNAMIGAQIGNNASTSSEKLTLDMLELVVPNLVLV